MPPEGMGKRSPEAMQGPVLFRTSNMDLLVPELRQKESSAWVDKAARISRRLIMTAHGHVDRTCSRARERNVRCYRGRSMVDGLVFGSGRRDYGAEWVREVGELQGHLGEQVGSIGEKTTKRC